MLERWRLTAVGSWLFSSSLVDSQRPGGLCPRARAEEAECAFTRGQSRMRCGGLAHSPPHYSFTTTAVRLGQQHRIEVEHQLLIGGETRKVRVAAEHVAAIEVAENPTLGGFVTVDVEQQNVDLVGIRADQVGMVVVPPGTAEYRRDPIVRVIVGAILEERSGDGVDHRLGDAIHLPAGRLRVAPARLRHPHGQAMSQASAGDGGAGGGADARRPASPENIEDLRIPDLRRPRRCAAHRPRPAGCAAHHRQREVVVELLAGELDQTVQMGKLIG